MIIVDPITLGDTSFSRPSVKNVYNGAGALVEVPANTLGVTYDPAELNKAPWALLEPAATNRIRNNTMVGAVVGVPFVNGSLPANWQLDTTAAQKVQIVQVQESGGVNFIDVRFSSTNNDRSYLALYPEPTNGTGVTGAMAGQVWAGSMYAEHVAGNLPQNNVLYVRAIGPAAEVGSWGEFFTPVSSGKQLRSGRVGVVTPALPEPSERVTMFYLASALPIGGSFDFTLRIGLPQLERDRVTSPIKTSNGAVTRSADVVGSVAGLLYSNVPITEPDYSVTATYAKDALVHDPATHNVFKSLIDANKGKPLTDPAAWNPRGATNRWAMLDQYNNTQTANPEEILIVLTPQAISEGLYIGNCDADEIELSVVDQSEGLVASAVTSLVTASGTSSYFDWCFRPADRSDYFVTTSMPPYANALVLVAIRKPGGIPKCGMLAIGAVDEFGPSLYGLSAEGKDYSSTTFNFDGTTNTEIRPYAKRMSVDVQVDNDEIDYIQRKLFQIRQRPIVWIGGPYGATAVFGRYGSFKIVIPGLKKSDMALQIEGSV